MMQCENSMMPNSFLTAFMTVNTTQANVGDVLGYTLTLTNRSAITLRCMFARIKIGTELEVEAGSIGINNVAIANQSLNLIQLPDLAPGSSSTVSFNAIVVRQPEQVGCPITTRAKVMFVAQNQKQVVTSSEVFTQVIPSIPVVAQDVVIHKCVDKSEAQVGETLGYTIMIRPAGYYSITNLVLTDLLDGNLELIPNTLKVNGYPVQSNLINLQLPNLYYIDCRYTPEICVQYSALVISRPTTIRSFIPNEAILSYTLNGIDYSVTSNTVLTEIVARVSKFNEVVDVNLLGISNTGVQCITDVQISNITVTPATNVQWLGQYTVNFTLVLTYVDYFENTGQFTTQHSIRVSYPYQIGIAYTYVVSCQTPTICNPYYVQVPITILIDN